jgi:glycosidase
MAFTRENPSRLVSFTDLLVEPGTGDPAEFRNSDHGSRAGFGGNPWRYDAKGRAGFDPVAGRDADSLIPARQYMKAYVSHWMDLYGIDGVRVDDIADIDNWDFNREFTQHARDAWQAARGDTAKFIVISEELGKPAELVRNGSTDAAWNEPWKRILRAVILGKNAESENEPSFEHSVRMLIDCRLRGFSDLAQAVNYLGSHDVGGFRNERIFNFLANNGVRDIGDISRRLRLAYAVLLTAAGIPMIFAGDEFADSQDLPLTDFGDRNKQIDPVNFSRLNEPWRRELFDYVARLVRLRVTHDGLARNETEFLHADFNDKRVLVWQRGLSTDPVVVVANFSDFGSAGGLAGEYFIPNFPRRDAEWFEVSQGEPRRRIARGAIGREPLFPWEAKVYMIATN